MASNDSSSHRLQISIKRERFEQIKAAADATGVSLSAWINTAIAEKLSRQTKAPPSEHPQ